jgi:hypothetical protein
VLRRALLISLSSALGVLGLLVAGCQPVARAPIQASAVVVPANPAVGSIHAVAAAAMIAPTCNGQREATRPATHQIAIAGRFVNQACGMLTIDVSQPAFVEAFTASSCGGTFDETCGQTYSDMFWARLHERYSQADWDWVLNRCKAYPDQCQQQFWIESWAVESHNIAVSEWSRQAVEHQRAQQAAIDEARLQRQIAFNQQRALANRVIALSALRALVSPWGCHTYSTGVYVATRCY